MRLLFLTSFILLSLLVFPFSVSANFLTVNETGEIEYSVLAANDELTLEIPKAQQLEVTDVASANPAESGVISLAKNEGKISMSVEYGNNTKEFEFSDYKDTLVEIEERPQVQSLAIGIQDNKFSLKHKGVVALTEFPISVNAKTAKITVSTERGERIVSVLPYSAVESLLKAKILSNVNENKLDLVESESELAYHITGSKILNLLDFYQYPVEISAYVSASTGEVVKVESPVWFRFVDFIFS